MFAWSLLWSGKSIISVLASQRWSLACVIWYRWKIVLTFLPKTTNLHTHTASAESFLIRGDGVILTISSSFFHQTSLFWQYSLELEPVTLTRFKPFFLLVALNKRNVNWVSNCLHVFFFFFMASWHTEDDSI